MKFGGCQLASHIMQHSCQIQASRGHGCFQLPAVSEIITQANSTLADETRLLTAMSGGVLLLLDATGAADVVLALHACGAASDWSLAQAASRSAAFIVSPCCIGKINKSNTAGLLYKQDSDNQQQAVQAAAVQVQQALQQAGQIQYPRSHWLMQHMDELAAKVQAEHHQHKASLLGATAAENAGQQQQQQQALSPLQQAVLQSDSRRQQCRALFSLMAHAADYSHQEDHSYPDLAALAKSNVELDRGLSMAEAGYSATLVRLLQPDLTAKSDVLVGVPAAGAREVAAAGTAVSALSWTWS
jgi:hypothetical protein